MSRNITIRNVREEVADELKRQAQWSGQSLQAFLSELLERTASTRPIEEIIADVEARLAEHPVRIGADEIVATIREFRDAASR